MSLVAFRDASRAPVGQAQKGVAHQMVTDEEVLERQYADDRNLRARQRLWEISRSEPQLDFNSWAVDFIGAHEGDLVLDAGCGNGRPLALLEERLCTAVGIDLSLGMARSAHHPRVAVGDVQNLPFLPGVFDAAAAFMMGFTTFPTRSGRQPSSGGW